VFELLAGEVIATVRAMPVTVIVLVSEPNTLEQVTVMVLLPATKATDAGDDAALPLTVQLIVPEPVALKATLIGVDALLEPVAGELIVVTGALPRITWTTAWPGPNELVQMIVIVLLPIVGSATELVVALVDDTPLIVQVVPPGIVAAPLTV
jgi:hypothetical protein